MAKLNRYYQRIFGLTGGPSGEIGRFGSLAAGSPTVTQDVGVMMSLSNWLRGWYGAVVGQNSPAIEDQNAVHYVTTFQLAYLFQQGIPEYDSQTEYNVGSLVNQNGAIFKSRTNANIGNALTNPTYWQAGARINNFRYTSPQAVVSASGIAVNSGDEDIYVGGALSYAGFTAASAGASALYSVTYSSKYNRYVALSVTASASQIQYSDNGGQTWTGVTLSASTGWQFVKWLEASQIFVAFGPTLTGDTFATSPDGITWATSTVLPTINIVDIAYSPSLGVYVAAAGDTFTPANSKIFTSPDGITWTQRTPASVTAFSSVAWSPSLGLFAILNIGVTNQSIQTSPDGITWTQRTAQIPGTGGNKIKWSDSLSLFVSVLGSGTQRVMTSPDGINWTLRTTPNAAFLGLSWSSDLGLFMAVGTDVAMSSPDGINWTSRAITTGNWRDIVWGSRQGNFVAVALNSSNQSARSAFIGTVDLSVTSPAQQIAPGIVDGDTKRILGVTNFAYNYVTLKTGTGIRLKSDWTSNLNNILTLRFDQTRALWVEASRG